jgi:hypothetical protein
MSTVYKKLVESFGYLAEDAPTEFKPTHFHKNNFGGRLSLMLHSDGNFYHMKQGQYPNQGRQEIAKWNFAKFDPEDRSAVNPTSIDGEFVNGKPVDYPEGVTWKTFNKEGQGARASDTMDTTPTDDQNKTSNYTNQDQKSPEPSAPEVDTPANNATSNYTGQDQKSPEGGTPFTPPQPEADKPANNATSNYTGQDQKSPEPSKEPKKPAEDPLLSPEDLKAKVARFKELLDKSLTREKEGQGPQVDPKPKPRPKPPKKPASGPYLGAGNSPGNVTFGGSMQGPGSTGQWNGQPVDVPAGTFGESQKLTIRDFISKLTEIENRSKNSINENISQSEQQELTKLFLDLSDPRYASNQDVARELDRYNSVMRDVDKYATSTFQPGSDQVGMPEVPRQPMPGEKTKPDNNKTPPLTGNQPAVMKMQKELKAAGADLGTYGSNKDGIDGNLGGKNSKTRQAMAKYPEIAKKYGFGATVPSGQSAMADPNAQNPAADTKSQKSMNDQAIAGMLFKSMSGIGTDSKMFSQAIMQIKTPQQFANVSKLYKAVSGEDLMTAIEDDFSGTDLGNIQRMLSKFQPKKESSELDRIKHLSGI